MSSVSGRMMRNTGLLNATLQEWAWLNTERIGSYRERSRADFLISITSQASALTRIILTSNHFPPNNTWIYEHKSSGVRINEQKTRLTEISTTDQFSLSALFLQPSTVSAENNKWKQLAPKPLSYFFQALIDFTKHKFWTASSKPEWSGHQKHSRSRDTPKKNKVFWIWNNTHPSHSLPTQYFPTDPRNDPF